MKQLLSLLLIGVLSCEQPPQKSIASTQDKVAAKASNIPVYGEKIQGDFNGDNQKDVATAVKMKEGQGSPFEGGTLDDYEIQFSGNTMGSITAGCCDIRLINEGDLTNDGTDEISVFQAPMNGCTYSMTTYSYINGTWKQIVELFLIPTGCDYMSDDDLQKRIFKEGNSIYYYDTDLNDEQGKLIKKKAMAK